MGLFSKRRPSPGATPPPGGPTFSPPNEAEVEWMAGHLAFARELGIDIADADHVATLYETLFDSWRQAAPDARSDPNMSINIVGTALGEHLVRSAGMLWVVATDDSGTELAVRHPATNALVYPANAVAKRWVGGESGSFVPAMSAHIRSLISG